MKAYGVEGVILGVFSPGNPPHDMANAADKLIGGGIPVRAWYGLPYYGSAYGATRDIKWAADLAKEYRTPYVFVDSEIDATGIFNDATTPTPASRVVEHRECYAIIHASGATPGTYTAPWWWNPKMGGTAEFADSPLWYANYGVNDSQQPPINIVNFGGWSKVAIHQYTSTLNVAGRNRDANYWFLQEDSLTKEDIVALFGSTERDPVSGRLLSVEERYPNAKTRYDEAVSTGKSLLEQVGNAMALAVNHGGGGIPAHQHEIAATTIGVPK
jgi:hypothetical protein